MLRTWHPGNSRSHPVFTWHVQSTTGLLQEPSGVYHLSTRTSNTDWSVALNSNVGVGALLPAYSFHPITPSSGHCNLHQNIWTSHVPTVISSLLYSKDPLRNLPFKDPASPQRLGHSEAGKILLWDLFQYFCSTPFRGLGLLMVKSTYTT